MALDAATQARLEEELLKKTYSNPGAENSNSVDEAQKKRLLEVVNKEKEKPNKFTQIVSDFYNSYITGEDRTEFPNMKEIYQAGDNFSGTNLAINYIKFINPDKDAQTEMIVKKYPGSKITKDIHDNIILTLPENVVGKGNDQSYYLDKAGVTVDGVANTTGQILVYIAGAGWVLKNSLQSGIKKAGQMGLAAGATGATFDVLSYAMGSTQGDGGLVPVVEDDKFIINVATAGMGGMQIGSQPAFGQMMAEGISPFTPLGTPVGQSTGLLGQEISNQALNSSLTGVPGFFEQQLGNTFVDDGFNLLGKGKTAIDEGWDDMSLSNKISTGTGAIAATDNMTAQPQNMIVPEVAPIDRRNPSPTMGKPLVTQIQGLQQAAPSAMMGQLSPKEKEEYYSLLRSI